MRGREWHLMSVDIARAGRVRWKLKKYQELSANAVAFICCRSRLTKVLASATRGEMGSKGGGGWVRLSDVDIRELAGFQSELICRFILAVGMVGGSIWEFVFDTDGPAFLERELMGTSRSDFTTVQVEWCPSTHFESIWPISPV